jgi:hypothetical protein
LPPSKGDGVDTQLFVQVQVLVGRMLDDDASQYTINGQEIEGSDTLRLVLAFRGVGCGLGPELAALVPLLVAARRRRAWANTRR